MKREIADALGKLRNELAHSPRKPDPVDIAQRLQSMGLEVPPAEMASLIPNIIKGMGMGVHHIPRDLLRIITELVSGFAARVVCDPWASIGAVISTLKDAAQPTVAIAIVQNESEAALALPAGAFAPCANIQTSLVVIRRRPLERTFVAQLSNESRINSEILTNFKARMDTGSIELGCLVDAHSFTGLESIRLADRLDEARRTFGFPARRLGELATCVNLGRYGGEPAFEKQENAIFVPLIGISDAVATQDELSLKAHNCAQVVINPSRSDARFVASDMTQQSERRYYERQEKAR